MFSHYLTIAWRNLWRHKVATLFNIVGLAFGLVCFVGAYLFTDYLRSHDVHFKNADRIFVIFQKTELPGSDNTLPFIPFSSPPVGKYVGLDFPELEQVARVSIAPQAPITFGNNAQYERICYADEAFFDIFDLPVAAKTSQKPLSTPQSAVITKSLAARTFGVAEAVGQSILLDNSTELSITAVIQDVRKPWHLNNRVINQRCDIFISMDVLEKEFRDAADIEIFSDNNLNLWTRTFLFTYVLLRENSTFDTKALKEGLATLGARHVPPGEVTVQFEARNISEVTLSFLESLIFAGALPVSATFVLLVIGGLVLATAAINYANLATAQAIFRSKEVGMRKVLGARRLQVMLQYLFESIALTAIALILAICAFELINPSLSGLLNKDFRIATSTDIKLWFVLLSVVLMVGIAAGAYPAFRLSQIRAVTALRSTESVISRNILRRILVGIQFGISSFLLITVIVISIQSIHLRNVAFASSEDQILVLNGLTNSGAGLDYQTFRQELLNSPHVKSMTATSAPPWSNRSPNIGLISKSPEAAAKQLEMNNVYVAPDFFATVETDILAGRAFSEDRADTYVFQDDQNPNVRISVILDRVAAEELGWPNPQDAIGQLLYRGFSSEADSDTNPETFEVIGVVERAPLQLMSFGGKRGYLHFLAPVVADWGLVKLSADGIEPGLNHIEAVWKDLTGNFPFSSRFLDEQFERGTFIIRLFSRVILALAILALAISSLGLFAMAVHVTGSRLHEIGVRKTLGANAQGIFRLLLWDFLKPVLIANIIIWPLAFLAMQVFLSLFVDRIALTPLPFLASLAVAIVIAVIAVSGRAIRAAHVRPSEVLRYE